MAISKKFLKEVSSQLANTNARVIKGIPTWATDYIASRPDVQAWLAGALFKTKMRNSLSAGFKSNAIRVKAYKNFNEFNRKARNDAFDFYNNQGVNQLANDDGILTIISKPIPNEVLMQISSQLVSNYENLAKSFPTVGLSFKNAVKSEYKFDGVYFIVMIDEDALIDKNEKFVYPKPASAVKAKMEKKKRTTKEIIDSYTKRAAKNQRQISKYQAAKSKAARQLDILNAQNQKIYNQFGKAKFNSDDLLNALDNFIGSQKDTELVVIISNAIKTGDKASNIISMAKSLDDKEMTKTIVRAIKGGALSSGKFFNKSTRKLKAEINALNDKALEIADLIVNSPRSERAKLKIKLAAVNRKLEELKIRYKLRGKNGEKFYSNRAGMLNKMMERAQKAIEIRIARGESLKSAIEKETAKLPVDDVTRLQIVHDSVQKMAEGISGQNAVSQAMQENLQDIL